MIAVVSRTDGRGAVAQCDGVRYLQTSYSHKIAFLSMFGDRNAVLALWAKLASGKGGYILVNGVYTSYADGEKYIKIETPINRHEVHVVLLHPEATNQSSMFSPNFIQLGPNSKELFFERLTRCCAIPMKRSWRDWLWNRGLLEGDITPLDGFGPLGYIVSAKESSWAATIKAGILSGELV